MGKKLNGCLLYVFMSAGVVMIVAGFLSQNDMQALRLTVQGILLLMASSKAMEMNNASR